ncbi:hypothetical protein WS67_11760 [Burkholderia singularis]|uniref:Uncharacterized protein n=1 Tax=Burkholderia singularis TaxID=1503053 RepID=A0A118DP40_9BURK|nr:hypothetical protein WS67_11760 [Burkholderia singularis]
MRDLHPVRQSVVLELAGIRRRPGSLGAQRRDVDEVLDTHQHEAMHAIARSPSVALCAKRIERRAERRDDDLSARTGACRVG